MSLDVQLVMKEPVKKRGTGVFVRRNGVTVELTVEEVKAAFPNAEHVEEQEYESNIVYSDNITHNLNEMAHHADLYKALWRPYQLHPDYNIEEDNFEAEHEFEMGCTILAKEIIPHLEKGLKELITNPEHYEKFNPNNGWGDYDGLVRFTREYLLACIALPEAEIQTDR